MRQFGLIGYPLSHSFSKKYFTEKFASAGMSHDHHYELYPIPDITDFPDLIANTPNLIGLNVTIPYKQSVMAYLDEIDENAVAIGAVNTIKIEAGKLKGYNTDVFGFANSLDHFLVENGLTEPISALILGTGGAALATAWVLEKKGINYRYVSRNPNQNQLVYSDLDRHIIAQYRLIINTTPLGMAPNIDSLPALPYEELNEKHLLYDLIYNPAETAFLKAGKAKGAKGINGLPMLHGQAEKAWEIWTNKTVKTSI